VVRGRRAEYRHWCAPVYTGAEETAGRTREEAQRAAAVAHS
jgi:hypothetical protein